MSFVLPRLTGSRSSISMLADASNVQFGPERLPNLGKSIPLAFMHRSYCRGSPGRMRNFAGELTPPPKYWQLERRFASRGGTQPANAAAGVRPPVRRLHGRRWFPAEPAGKSDCASSSEAGGLQHQRTPLCVVWSRTPVDTQKASDTLPNLKTYGISISSASFCPPVSCFAALLRRSWRLVSGDDRSDDRRSGRGVLSWSAVRRRGNWGSANSAQTSIARSTYFVGETQRSNGAEAVLRPAWAFDPSSPTLLAVVGPPRTPNLGSAACTLQECSAGMVHNWP